MPKKPTPQGHRPSAKDRKQVETMAGFGIPQEAIAKLIGVSPPTLRKYYRDELDLGATKANMLVVQSLFNMATGRNGQKANPASAMFWCKTRLGWRETDRDEADDRQSRTFVVEFTGAPGVKVEPKGGE